MGGNQRLNLHERYRTCTGGAGLSAEAMKNSPLDEPYNYSFTDCCANFLESTSVDDGCHRNRRHAHFRGDSQL